MTNHPRIVALNGSYRKGGTIDSAIDEILAAARASGALTEKIYLTDQRLQMCKNCRICTQEAGVRRGLCVLEDDMDAILDRIEAADVLVIGSPVNFATVTAVMKVFLERLVCYAYWPWGTAAPKTRNPRHAKRAVVIAASAAPALPARWSSNVVKLLKQAALLLGARKPEVLFIGLAAMQQQAPLTNKVRAHARRIGTHLVS